jgi:hypothetical protein
MIPWLTKNTLKTATIFLSFFVLSLLYIHPGEIPLLERSLNQMLSSGVDPVIMPYIFDFFKHTFQHSSADLFYGGVVNPQLDFPYGMVIWDPLLERVQVLLLSFFLPIEQVGTGLVVLSLFFNAISMYWLASKLELPSGLGWSMGIAWAFNPYTRAAAKVFLGLVGTYHLPLLFIGLLQLRENTFKSKIIASILFAIISFMPHYYIVTLAFSLPLIITFCAINEVHFFKYLGRVFTCAIPGILWLIFSLVKPVPAQYHSIQAFPNTGQAQGKYHEFLNLFAAQPLDYFAGDIGSGHVDINPLRAKLSKDILEQDYPMGHTQDRAIGIRWVFIIGALIGLLQLLPSSKAFWKQQDRKHVVFFFFFGLFYLWMSLPPDWPFDSFGGSYWVYRLIPQVRTPSRAGLGFNFSLIIISGLLIKNYLETKAWTKFRKDLGVFLFSIIVFFELPPLLQDMPLSKVDPNYKDLESLENCGVGVRLPYISLKYEDLRYLSFLQRMRETDCRILNSSIHNSLDKKLYQNFSKFNFKKSQFDKLKKFGDCSKLNWIVFGLPVTQNEAEKICNQLSWEMKNDGVCVNREPHKSPNFNILKCL